MGTKSFGSILIEDWIEKLLFAAAILPGIPLLFLGNAQPWGKYVLYCTPPAWALRYGRHDSERTGYTYRFHAVDFCRAISLVVFVSIPARFPDCRFWSAV
jgi:hypothetical protein